MIITMTILCDVTITLLLSEVFKIEKWNINQKENENKKEKENK